MEMRRKEGRRARFLMREVYREKKWRDKGVYTTLPKHELDSTWAQEQEGEG